MDEKLAAAAREYHAQPTPGKIEVRPTKPYATQHDLTMAYSPGVAVPCIDIAEDPQKVYDYTAKGNLVAVISNGTAVLGLGNIGPAAGKPVMEGKGLLFKIYAGVDVFDIEVDIKDPDRFVEVVKAIAPSFGGINLEDIKAPECFAIEERLRAELDIPVMHDDQHGTAIISAAGLLNALRIAGKKIENIKLVVNGAGASAYSCTRLYESFGVKHENILMLDSKGVITKDRKHLTEQKAYFATDRQDVKTLEEAIVGADVFVGLSRGGVLKPEMVKRMAKHPIVFALANPDPEITYPEAKAARPDIIMATGRSDYPNQINNVIGFPYIFRGALDVRATAINEEMKHAAALAIAELAREDVPEEVMLAYGQTEMRFGPDYIIPKPVDSRLVVRVSTAVARAAMESGVAKKPIEDWGAYEAELLERIGIMSHLTQRFYETAKRHPKRMVYPAAGNPNLLKAAVEAKRRGIAVPVILGDSDSVQTVAQSLSLDIAGIEIVNPRGLDQEERRQRYAKQYADQNWRRGGDYAQALELMYTPDHFGMMMVQMGEADAMLSGVHGSLASLADMARSTVGLQPGHSHCATMHMVALKRGPVFLADTKINHRLDAQALVDIAVMAYEKVRCYGVKPVLALVSYSDFGAEQTETTREIRRAVEILHREYDYIPVDGEMQVRQALHHELRDRRFPQNRIAGQNANVLIFPRLSAASASYQLLQEADDVIDIVGPITMGLAKPVYFVDHDASVQSLLSLTALSGLEQGSCIV
ncbi:MAG: NADP-dependent malic enzyme [Bacteroidia bacterium]|nr:MAG: NADP-dependent malic enzyme [Bacteroidia bacterium]